MGINARSHHRETREKRAEDRRPLKSAPKPRLAPATMREGEKGIAAHNCIKLSRSELYM